MDVTLKLVKNIITIDGPGGVGKGTLAFSLAKKLNWNVLDSGLIYRLIGYLYLKEGIDTSKKIISYINKSKIQLITNLNAGICEIELNDKVLGLSLIHIPSPRDRSLSRMPSSA